MGSEQDIRNRIRRAGGVWGKVKDGLKGLGYLRNGRLV